MKLFEQITDGESVGNGIHWHSGPYSRLVVYFVAGKFGARVRWKPHGLWPKFCFRRAKTNILPKGIEFYFDTYSLKINGVLISVELLECMSDPNPNALYRFERQGDIVRVERRSG